MILIEIISEEALQMFYGIPKEYHKSLIGLYNKGLKSVSNKPQFVKVSSLELIRMKFIQDDFKEFDVKNIIDEFTNYYYELQKSEIEKVRFGFLEDLKELLLEYLETK